MIHINLNDILYTCRAESYQNNLHKILYGKTNKHTHLFVCFKSFCLDQMILLHQVNSAMGLACVVFNIHLQRLSAMGLACVVFNIHLQRLSAMGLACVVFNIHLQRLSAMGMACVVFNIHLQRLSAMGLACVVFNIHLQGLLWMYSLGNARVKGNDRADRLTGKVTIASLRVGRSEVLRCLRHYLLAQSQGHHTIDHLEEKRKVTLPENLKDFKRFKLSPSIYLFIY